MSRPAALPFETDIQELEALLARLESTSDQQGGTLEEIRRIRRELTNLTRKIYNNLGAWETVLADDNRGVCVFRRRSRDDECLVTVDLDARDARLGAAAEHMWPGTAGRRSATVT